GKSGEHRRGRKSRGLHEPHGISAKIANYGVTSFVATHACNIVWPMSTQTMQCALEDVLLALAATDRPRSPRVASARLYSVIVPLPSTITSPLTRMLRSVPTCRKSVDGRPAYSPCEISNSCGSGRPIARNHPP